MMLESKGAIFGYRGRGPASRNANWAAGVVRADIQGVLRSKRECHHSLRRGRFTPGPYSEGPGCLI